MLIQTEHAMKQRLFALLHACGVTRFASWCHRHRIVFLCYHGVTKLPARSPRDPKGLHVNHRRFKAQLDFLQRHYQVISLREYLQARTTGRRLPDYSAVVTFDDGFRNFLTVAAPLLAARGIPATLFLITDKASEATNPNPSLDWAAEDDERHLSWNEARILKDEMGFEIGSHTCSHSGLLTLSAKESERELERSQNDLVTHLRVTAPSLSYPKGQYSRLLADVAHRLGYACAVTTDRGLNEQAHDPFTLGRTLIGDNDDIASFAVRVSGLRWWLVKLREPFVSRPVENPQRAPIPAPRPEVRLTTK
jgi:peptidoglycan/xylan/chitin deacetylase (PgdA/CDA1 family)